MTRAPGIKTCAKASPASSGSSSARPRSRSCQHRRKQNTVLVDFTAIPARSSTAVNRLITRTTSGGYQLEAIQESALTLMRRSAPRPVIVVLALEGKEFSSLSPQDASSTTLRRSGALVHVVSVGKPSTKTMTSWNQRPTDSIHEALDETIDPKRGLRGGAAPIRRPVGTGRPGKRHPEAGSPTIAYELRDQLRSPMAGRSRRSRPRRSRSRSSAGAEGRAPKQGARRSEGSSRGPPARRSLLRASFLDPVPVPLLSPAPKPVSCGHFPRIIARRRSRRQRRVPLAGGEKTPMTFMRPTALAGAVLFLGVIGSAATRPPDIPFRIQMLDGGSSETAAVADINSDGRLDIVSGEHWYEGAVVDEAQVPRARLLEQLHRRLQRSAGRRRRRRLSGHRQRHLVREEDLVVPESRQGRGRLGRGADQRRLQHRVRDARRHRQRRQGDRDRRAGERHRPGVVRGEYSSGLGARPARRSLGEGARGSELRVPSPDFWIKHVVSDRSYGHGIGFGDVNKDGRNDILTPRGWLEAPADPRAAGNWTYHAAWESVNVPVTPREAPAARRRPVPRRRRASPSSGSCTCSTSTATAATTSSRPPAMTSACSGSSRAPDGKWTKRIIDNAWSQGHASTLIDINGDGRLDFVTGKRFMAHNGSDPGEREPLGVYWYEYRPVAPAAGGGAPQVEWIRHLIDLRRPHGRRHADPRRRSRRRRRSRHRLRGEERAVSGREPHEGLADAGRTAAGRGTCPAGAALQSALIVILP